LIIVLGLINNINTKNLTHSPGQLCLLAHFREFGLRETQSKSWHDDSYNDTLSAESFCVLIQSFEWSSLFSGPVSSDGDEATGKRLGLQYYTISIKTFQSLIGPK